MQKRLMFWVPVGLYILLLVYVGLFKVGNTDFWWHIKAGQLLRDSGWIVTDPFAYAREGLLYLANHEWLAQVILSIVWDIGSVFGMTSFRILVLILTFGLPLLLNRNALWINGALAVLAAAASRPALTDRPQLFTFLMFSIIVCLCLAYFEASKKLQKRILLYFPVAIVLWSNLHGAAAVTGVIIIGLMLLQEIIGNLGSRELGKLGTKALALAPALALALLITPSGLGNISYIFNLFTDNTANVISEWQPSAWNIYLLRTLPFWFASIASVALVRRRMVFCILTLLAFGYLSRSAVRHEPLFILAALAITIYQLTYSEWWNSLTSRLQKHPQYSIAVAFLCIVSGVYAHVTTYDVSRVHYLFGYGLHAPMAGAYEFIEEQNIEGPMFNNYNAGGELLYRGYPERKVFVDGRNIDYGYEFLMDAINAGVDKELFSKLEEKYGFTHAVIYYDIQANQDPLPFTDLLDSLPDWHLVYLDDFAAVYTKTGDSLLYATPKVLSQQIIPEKINQTEFNALQTELNQIINWQPQHVKARLYLARLYMLLGAYEPSEILLEEALQYQPKNYKVYVGLSQLATEKFDDPLADFYFKKAKRKAGFIGVYDSPRR